MIAFNTGSQGSISQPGDGTQIAKVTINTMICAMTSATSGLIYHRFVVDRSTGYWNSSSGINGSFVGMVTIVIEPTSVCKFNFIMIVIGHLLRWM